MKSIASSFKIKKVIGMLIILTVIIAGAIYYFTEIQGRPLALTGIAEATIYPQTVELPGKLLVMNAVPGAKISQGDTLAEIDNTDQQYAREELALRIAKARINLADMQTGRSGSSASNNAAAVSANYNSAAAAADKALQDYNTAKGLYEQGAIPKQELDQAKLAMESSSYAKEAAEAQLNTAKNGTNASALAVDIKEMETQLAQLDENLGKTIMRASKSGIILSRNYMEGDMVSTGYNLCDIAADKEYYLTFYLPEELLPEISYDEKISFRYSDKEYSGSVKFIDIKSAYTPKDFQTSSNKNKESFKIKLLIPGDVPLKPGEKAIINLPRPK